MQMQYVKALADLQLRLDAAVEARNVASESHKAALEGWAQKRKDYEDLQGRKMLADEEALKQQSLLDRALGTPTDFALQK